MGSISKSIYWVKPVTLQDVQYVAAPWYGSVLLPSEGLNANNAQAFSHWHDLFSQFIHTADCGASSDVLVGVGRGNPNVDSWSQVWWVGPGKTSDYTQRSHIKEPLYPGIWIVITVVNGVALRARTYSLKDVIQSYDVPFPNPKSLWVHRNGAEYEVLMITNSASKRPEYPETVVYRTVNVADQKLWSRPLIDWHRSFTPLVATAGSRSNKP